jgi:enoyl-CoA hydratase/carnithine racemase
MTTEPVTWELGSGVARLTLARPDRHNVLDGPLLDGLARQLDRAATDEAVRVVVLAAAGTTFCAGADLRGPADGAPGSFAGTAASALAGVLAAVMDHPKPVVARVQGHVAGGGNGLVAACDIAVASDVARFGFTEVRVGVAPAVIAVPLLRRLSPADASMLLLTGRRIDAEAACAVGLVQQVVPPDRLDDAVQSYVTDLLQGGPEALAATKQVLQQVPQLPRDQAFAWAAQLSAERFASTEASEGMRAFVEKRRPGWAP